MAAVQDGASPSRSPRSSPRPWSVLVVSDPHQGSLALEIVQRRLCVPTRAATVTLVIWNRRHSAAAAAKKKEARDAIRGGPDGDGKTTWDITISFNNDLVFQQADLDMMGDIRLNIHPSLIRGLGYGTWPIIFNHKEYGVLLHFLTLEVDRGPIISRLALPLPENATFAELRLRSQVLALVQLSWATALIASCDSLGRARERLADLAGRSRLSWSEEYVSGAERDATLRDLFCQNPEHRVFCGMPMNDDEDPVNVTSLPHTLEAPLAGEIVLADQGKYTSAGL